MLGFRTYQILMLGINAMLHADVCFDAVSGPHATSTGNTYSRRVPPPKRTTAQPTRARVQDMALLSWLILHSCFKKLYFPHRVRNNAQAGAWSRRFNSL